MNISENVNVFGWATKIITLEAKQNKELYRLSDQQRLGLPDGSMVLGFMIRANNGATTEKSINNRPLVDISVLRACYLNLKGRGDTTILADANLNNFYRSEDNNVNYQPFIEPISVDLISWGKTYIRVAGETARSLITGNEDIEIIVLYKTDATYKIPPPTQTYLNGLSVYAYKHNTIQIDLSTNKTRFPLTQDGKSGIDVNNVIFGFRFQGYNYQTPDSKTQPSDALKGSAFFTLQIGRENVLEKFPLNQLYPFNLMQMAFFPIEPLLAGAIDWQSSEFFISDQSALKEDTAILLQVFYYEPKKD
ncbi:hypothetical protein [Aureispira sp. CCB-E]|uniref:hypothetical protein n=1 Tax=Aureispira sp. CCB-E TaxID=3051121 RepID=UPI002868591D|nr:hypothetical protein [Aureispira sp. CCB-E]WMX12300.1 hypothetical protein QP953_15840 [Aureispira sp. CCB-E]